MDNLGRKDESKPKEETLKAEETVVKKPTIYSEEDYDNLKNDKCTQQ